MSEQPWLSPDACAGPGPVGSTLPYPGGAHSTRPHLSPGPGLGSPTIPHRQVHSKGHCWARPGAPQWPLNTTTAAAVGTPRPPALEPSCELGWVTAHPWSGLQPCSLSHFLPQGSIDHGGSTSRSCKARSPSLLVALCPHQAPAVTIRRLVGEQTEVCWSFREEQVAVSRGPGPGLTVSGSEASLPQSVIPLSPPPLQALWDQSHLSVASEVWGHLYSFPATPWREAH
jgi:hypothetical protein